jgi:hypothetical protein
MHDWYRIDTLFEALSRSIIGTWFMDDVEYIS